MSQDKEDPPTAQEPSPASEQPPPFRPDPDLIAFLERDAKPGEVRVWKPEPDDRAR
jgi:hypothetical protein